MPLPITVNTNADGDITDITCDDCGKLVPFFPESTVESPSVVPHACFTPYIAADLQAAEEAAAAALAALNAANEQE